MTLFNKKHVNKGVKIIFDDMYIKDFANEVSGNDIQQYEYYNHKK